MRVGRIALNLFIIFHLSVALIVPMQSSFIFRSLQSVLIPYANLLGLNSAWQFFSPDPAPAIFYEYETVDEQGEREKFYFPTLEDPFWFRPSYNRRVAVIRISARLEDVRDVALVPYLCRKHENAISIDLTGMTIKFPSIEEVEAGLPLNDTSLRQFQYVGEQNCLRGGAG